MTRIAYVINSMEGGGTVTPLPAIVDVLRRSPADVRVLALTARNGRGLPGLAAAEIDVRVRDGGERDHLAALRWLACEVDAFRPDLLWTSLTRATLLGQEVGRRRRLPVVSWQHNAYLRPSNLLLLRVARSRSALWVSDSAAVAELTRRRLRVGDDRLATWPLFAAVPEAPVARAWRPGETLRIGSLGRLHRAKGYDRLAEALAILARRGLDGPPIDVAVAGDGPERGRLELLVARLAPGRMRLVGHRPDGGRFLAGLHLYVQPSRREGLCIAAHEAMNAGLPVVASAVGGLPDAVSDGETGFLVPPEDPERLADAIGRCVARPDRLAGMGAEARRRVLDRFSRSRFEANGTEIVRRALDLVGPRRRG